VAPTLCVGMPYEPVQRARMTRGEMILLVILFAIAIAGLLWAFHTQVWD